MALRWTHRFRVARWWSEALTATSKSDYAEALKYILLMEQNPADGEGQRHRFQVKLLKGYVLGGLGRRDEALRTLISFQKDVQELGLANDELRYLGGYAAAVGTDIMKTSGDWDLTTDDKALFVVDYENIDLAKVPTSVKRHFPLRYHPRWTDVG